MHYWKTCAAIAALLMTGLPAVAQTALHSTPTDPVVFQPAAEVEAMTRLADGKTTASKIVVDHENYFIEYVTRAANTQAEAHGHWYDYVHVLAGEGTVTYGGTQEGGRDTGDLEVRGGTLVGAKTQLLHAGDRIVLPPGVPHLFTGTPGHTLTYLIFKQRR
jgi:quercetin dioxygenase-like cupin family protein